MTRKPITALSALLVLHGRDEADARREVVTAFAKHFAVMGAG